MKKTLNGRDVAAMTDHWLNTPLNGYLGSDYGQDIKSTLQQPQSSAVANNLIQKLQQDVPIIAAMPDESVGVYAVPRGVDGTDIILAVAGRTFNLSDEDN